MVCSGFAVYVLANNTVCTIFPPLCMAKGDHAQLRIWYKLCIIIHGTNMWNVIIIYPIITYLKKLSMTEDIEFSCHHYKVYFYLRSTDNV